MKSIKKNVPTITDENEKEYWIEYKKTLSLQIREAFVVKYADLVKYAAHRIRAKISKMTIADIDDLVGCGYLGLLDAIDKYNPDKGSVTSLNEVWYMGDDSDEVCIIDTLKSSDKINPEYLAERAEIQKEIGEILGVSESRVSQIHNKAIQDLRYILSEIKKSLL